MTTNSNRAHDDDDDAPFPFPPIHSFPPFYTLQPNATTREAQVGTWSTIIRDYCRRRRLYTLVLSDAAALDSDLFVNRALGKRLHPPDVRRVLEFMREREGSAEPAAADAGNVWWIWWRKVEEWAVLLEAWIDETGQKNTVLTLYELTEGDLSRGTEFHDMPPNLLHKILALLVKKGKAQVFSGSEEDQQGVKFY